MSRYLTSAVQGLGRRARLSALMPMASCVSPPDAGLAPAAPAARLAHLARQHHVCGAAVAVIQQRELQSVTTASGCDPVLQVRPDSVFQAASLSKPVFAYAVLKLVQRGAWLWTRRSCSTCRKAIGMPSIRCNQGRLP